jgi:hypothetical protein
LHAISLQPVHPMAPWSLLFTKSCKLPQYDLQLNKVPSSRFIEHQDYCIRGIALKEFWTRVSEKYVTVKTLFFIEKLHY